MQIKEALKQGIDRLTNSSSSARLDAELLLSYTLGRDLTFLMAHNEEKLNRLAFFRYQRLIKKRREGIPVAYLLGSKEFYCMDFEVNRHVLVPRPDTEVLVEMVIDYFGAQTSDLQAKHVLLDVGTGSGCIPVSVLSNVGGLRGLGVDVSSLALKVARRNVLRHGLSDRLQMLQSDLLGSVEAGQFDGSSLIVTANLPYLRPLVDRNVNLRHEPQVALYGGLDGLDYYRRLFEELALFRPKAVFLELFEDQIKPLMFGLKAYQVEEVRNMTGEARALFLSRK